MVPHSQLQLHRKLRKSPQRLPFTPQGPATQTQVNPGTHRTKNKIAKEPEIISCCRNRLHFFGDLAFDGFFEKPVCAIRPVNGSLLGFGATLAIFEYNSRRNAQSQADMFAEILAQQKRNFKRKEARLALQKRVAQQTIFENCAWNGFNLKPGALFIWQVLATF